MSDVEDDNEIGQQLQDSNDKSKEITAAIQAINLEPKEKQRDPKSKAHADTPRMENMAKQIELIQSALQQQPYSMTQAMKEAQEVMEQVWAERDSFKKVAVKQKDLDYCVCIIPLCIFLFVLDARDGNDQEGRRDPSRNGKW